MTDPWLIVTILVTAYVVGEGVANAARNLATAAALRDAAAVPAARAFPDAADLAPRPVDLSKAYIVRSLNPTANKPLHLGHLRNAVLGAATAGSLEVLGARVLRHCVVEDTGRFMTEAMAAVADFERSGDVAAVAATFRKPDHFIGHCYAQHRRKTAGRRNGAAASIAYDGRNDAADDLQRALVRGDDDARRVWRTVRTMTLSGQQATLQRLGVTFECCDFESAEDAVLDEFIAHGVARGIFTRNAAGEVVFTASNGYELRLVNRVGLAEESARLLSFIRRLLAGWPGDRVNVIIAGSEWKASMEVYPELLHILGVEQIRDMYAQAFYGMVTLNGKKMASSAGPAVLVDDLLDELAAGDEVGELSQRSGGRVGTSELAATIVKSLLLSVARTERLEFDAARLHDPETSPGWAIAAAWAELTGASRSTAQAAPSREARRVILDALARFSFEGAVTHARRLADAILDGTATRAERRDFPTMVHALSVVPLRSDFAYDRAEQLTAAPPRPSATRTPETVGVV